MIAPFAPNNLCPKNGCRSHGIGGWVCVVFCGYGPAAEGSLCFSHGRHLINEGNISALQDPGQFFATAAVSSCASYYKTDSVPWGSSTPLCSFCSQWLGLVFTFTVMEDKLQGRCNRKWMARKKLTLRRTATVAMQFDSKWPIAGIRSPDSGY